MRGFLDNRDSDASGVRGSAGELLGHVLLRTMKWGLVARIAFLDGTARRQITVPVSLMGFNAAFRSGPQASEGETSPPVFADQVAVCRG